MADVVLRDAAGVGSLIEHLSEGLAHALAQREAAIVGIRRGGVALARRVARRLETEGLSIDLGTVDIALYRDDVHLSLPRPETGPSDILFPVDGRDVVLIDDVFWTGRTTRAALDAVLDFGRPRRLWLATLVTRPGRELPVVPDITALEISPRPGEKIELRLTEDGHAEDALVLVSGGAP